MSPSSPCATSSKTTTTDATLCALDARGRQGGVTVSPPASTVIGRRSEQIHTQVRGASALT